MKSYTYLATSADVEDGITGESTIDYHNRRLLVLSGISNRNHYTVVPGFEAGEQYVRKGKTLQNVLPVRTKKSKVRVAGYLKEMGFSETIDFWNND